PRRNACDNSASGSLGPKWPLEGVRPPAEHSLRTTGRDSIVKSGRRLESFPNASSPHIFRRTPCHHRRAPSANDGWVFPPLPIDGSPRERVLARTDRTRVDVNG